jgi:glyoxylase-like metal-dependent hydrolase (beta-lactamase superfamily II)
MVAALQAWGAELDAVVLTHAHLDHVEGVPVLRDYRADVPIRLHEADLPLYRAVDQQAAAFGLSAPRLPEPDRRLDVDQVIEVGRAHRLRVRPAPGHAPGHVILIDDDAGVALVGDVVFQGSIGRTDLPGGDLRALMRSIRGEVLTLPDDTRLLPGHGPETTVAHERVGNPFLVPHYLGQFA